MIGEVLVADVMEIVIVGILSHTPIEVRPCENVLGNCVSNTGGDANARV
jgi:hypothetical protein